MEKVQLLCSNIEKRYNGKLIFKDLNINLSNRTSLVITGRNGSGKSTLLKVISGLIRNDKGSVVINVNEKELPREKHYKKLGMLAPYINLYDEFTAYENLEFFFKLTQKEFDCERIFFLLNTVGLFKRKNDLVRNYSSGMKQRLKLAFAVLNSPPVLLFDEPRTNLDEEGIDIVYEIAEEQLKQGILIVATNEKEDLQLCNSVLNLEDYK